MKLVSLAVTAASVGQVAAFWRMPCRSTTGIGRLDPIVTPGQINDHVHIAFGSGSKSCMRQADGIKSQTDTITRLWPVYRLQVARLLGLHLMRCGGGQVGILDPAALLSIQERHHRHGAQCGRYAGVSAPCRGCIA